MSVGTSVARLTTLQTQFYTTIAVRMDEETKSKLEELQAEIKLKTGKKVTQQEVLSRLVESVSESRSEFIDSFREIVCGYPV